jgi:hypothetical protein
MAPMLTRSRFLKAARFVLAAFLLVQASFAVSCVIAEAAMPQTMPCHDAGSSPADGSPCAAQCAAAAPVAHEGAMVAAQSTVQAAAIVRTGGDGIRVQARTTARPGTAAPPATVPRRILLQSFLI